LPYIRPNKSPYNCKNSLGKIALQSQNSLGKIAHQPQNSLEKIALRPQNSLKKNTKSTRTVLNHPEKYHVEHAIKLGDYNIGYSGGILTLPLYLGFLIPRLGYIPTT